MILEIDLNYFIGEPEHDSMLSSHPFLDVDRARRVLLFISRVHFVPLYELFFLLRIVILLQVTFEMLKQGHFLLEIWWISLERKLAHHVLLFIIHALLTLIVEELVTRRLRYYLGAIIKKDSC